MSEPVDFESRFYKNCAVRRKQKAKICQSCPFRAQIEAAELGRSLGRRPLTRSEKKKFGLIREYYRVATPKEAK